MNKRLFAISCFAILLFGGVAATVVADQNPAPQPRMHRGPGRGPGGPMGPMGRGPGGPGGPGLPLHGLDLTDAQHEQIRAIHESNRSAFEQVGTRLRDAHRALFEATQGGAVDEANVRARSGELANAIADEAILRGRVHAQVLNVLTAEQRQTLEQRRQQMEARRGQAELRRHQRRR